MKYCLNGIKINSNWFDKQERKKNVYDKIGYKGLNLYFQLYKFRLHNQENEHTFIPSISLLRKETGYTTNEVFELLKKLKSANVIKIENLSRWDLLIDKATGKVKDDKSLVITAVNPLSITDKRDEQYYIYVPLNLFELYKEKGLNEKYYALYCLIQKWSHNTERKMYMSIHNMAKILGFDKNTVNKMIVNLNRNYFMYSNRRRKSNGEGYQYEHYILTSGNETDIDTFVNLHKSNIDVLIRRWDKNKVKEEVAFIEELECDVLDEYIHNNEPVFAVEKLSVDELEKIFNNEVDGLL